MTNEITDFGDAIIKMDVDNEYAKFFSYYLIRTGMRVNPEEVKAVKLGINLKGYGILHWVRFTSLKIPPVIRINEPKWNQFESEMQSQACSGGF